MTDLGYLALLDKSTILTNERQNTKVYGQCCRLRLQAKT